MPHPPPTPWHRLFGIALTDVFAGRPWRVELEMELALKSQRLDVLIIERLTGQAAACDPADLADLPDGLDTLGAHNILTYKSARESLGAWALDELIGHYVTYRKLVSYPPAAGATATAPPPDRTGREAPAPAHGRLRPAADFRLYAVATRLPTRLLRALHPSARRPTAWPGVYDLTWGQGTIRLIVLNAIADHPRNAPWGLFASELTRVRYGLDHYRPREAVARLLRYHLAQVHQLELLDMAYTLDDFKHDTWRMLIDDIDQFSSEERAALLERMGAEDRLRGLSPDEVFKRYTAEDRLRGLPAEDRLRGLPAEEILRGLDPDVIRAWLKRSGS